MRGTALERWGELTDDDLTEAEVEMEQLAGNLQQRYGRSQAVAQREVEEWSNKV